MAVCRHCSIVELMELNDHEINRLVIEGAKGDAQSCQKLYEHLVEKVYPYVRYRVARNEQATDVTQDVFIDFFATLKAFTFQTRAQFYAYVFVITRRKLARYYNKASHKLHNETVEFDETTTPLLEVDGEGSAENRLDVIAALRSLDEQTREIVVLHHWSQYTFGEIAQLLDLKEAAVRVRHHRALQRLATILTR